MQTRQLEQVLVYKLCLNDMRSSKIEVTDLVAIATSKNKLEAFLQDNKVELYRDGNWGKTFKKDSPLEWYNEPFSYEWQGILEQWISLEDLESAKQRILFID